MHRLHVLALKVWGSATEGLHWSSLTRKAAPVQPYIFPHLTVPCLSHTSCFNQQYVQYEDLMADIELPDVAVTNEKRQKSGKLKELQVRKAVSALLKWSQSREAGNKDQLIEEDDIFCVVISLKKTPEQSRTNGFRIPLPHSLYPLHSGREVCLIVKDSKEGGHKAAKEKLAKEDSVGVTKVIGVTKLRTNYKPYEAKRQLCGSYDIFLADDRVLPLLPRLLGKSFFKKKKHPIPVNLKGGKWGEKIRAACDATYLYISDGPCSLVRAARLDQSEDEIAENIMAVVAGVAEVVPKKWKNIQSIYLKLHESASLPLYQSLPDQPLKIS